MTINEVSEFHQGKRVVDFTFGDDASDGDVVYRLCQEYDSEESQRELLDSLLEAVDPKTLSALIFGPWADAQGNSPAEYLERLIERRTELPALASLFVGDMTFEDCEISWINQTGYNGLLDAFPHLRALRVRGSSSLELKPFKHAELEELAIECGGLPSAIVDAIAQSELPALRHLELWLGDDNYGYDGDLATYQRLLGAIRPERLRYLGLRNASNADELAAWLATQPWIGTLQTLDLSLGTLGDAGAKALCASPHLGNLEFLNLSHHYISPEWQAKLKALPCRVDVSDAESEDDGERYVAVAE